MLEKLNFAGNY